MQKICSRCHQAKDLKEFYFCKTSKKYNNYCKDCKRLYNREYRRKMRKREKEAGEKGGTFYA